MTAKLRTSTNALRVSTRNTLPKNASPLATVGTRAFRKHKPPRVPEGYLQPSPGGAHEDTGPHPKIDARGARYRYARAPK